MKGLWLALLSCLGATVRGAQCPSGGSTVPSVVGRSDCLGGCPANAACESFSGGSRCCGLSSGTRCGNGWSPMVFATGQTRACEPISFADSSCYFPGVSRAGFCDPALRICCFTAPPPPNAASLPDPGSGGGVGASALCSVGPEPGQRCFESPSATRYYFDKASQRCLRFTYEGCGGNSNNFETEKACVSSCGAKSGPSEGPGSEPRDPCVGVGCAPGQLCIARATCPSLGQCSLQPSCQTLPARPTPPPSLPANSPSSGSICPASESSCSADEDCGGAGRQCFGGRCCESCRLREREARDQGLTLTVHCVPGGRFYSERLPQSDPATGQLRCTDRFGVAKAGTVGASSCSPSR